MGWKQQGLTNHRTHLNLHTREVRPPGEAVVQLGLQSRALMESQGSLSREGQKTTKK